MTATVPHVTTRQAADYLGVDIRTICDYCRDGKIKAHKEPWGERRRQIWAIQFESILNFDDRRSYDGMNVRQAASRLGCGVRAVSDYVATGRLHPIYETTPGRPSYFDPLEVEVLRQELQPPPGYINVKQAAGRLQVTLGVMYHLGYNGYVRTVRRGKSRYFLEKDVEFRRERKRRTDK